MRDFPTLKNYQKNPTPLAICQVFSKSKFFGIGSPVWPEASVLAAPISGAFVLHLTVELRLDYGFFTESIAIDHAVL